MFQNRICLLTALFALTASALGGCTSPDANSAASAAELAAKYPFGSRADSLNGIEGHHFGDPLSTFKDLELLPGTRGEEKTYSYTGTAGWFGKNQDKLSTLLYSFYEGKFTSFLAVGRADVLRPEAVYLLGEGQKQGNALLFWEGAKARAVYEEKPVMFGREGRLDVLSKAYEADKAAREQAQLKADNAQ